MKFYGVFRRDFVCFFAVICLDFHLVFGEKSTRKNTSRHTLFQAVFYTLDIILMNNGINHLGFRLFVISLRRYFLLLGTEFIVKQTLWRTAVWKRGGRKG